MEMYGILFGIIVFGGAIVLSGLAMVLFGTLALCHYGRYKRGDIGAFMVFLGLGGCAATVLVAALLVGALCAASMFLSPPS